MLKGLLILYFFMASGFASERPLECKTDANGNVALTFYVPYASGTQQMVYRLGQETWQEPNRFRPQCEKLKNKFVVYKGEEWSAPYCICEGSFSNLVSVFASTSGEEIQLTPDNFFDNFKGYSWDAATFRKPVNWTAPECQNACWP